MREQLEQRLQELRAEYENGKNVLADLDTRRENVQRTVLRISGAIQVLEELLRNQDNPDAPARALHMDS